MAEDLGVEAPRYRTVGGVLREEMRYGENPHQKAAFYVTGENRPGVATAALLQGKQLSYNNINDTDAAFELVAEFSPKRVRLAPSSSTPTLRRRHRRLAEGSLSQGARLRFDLGLRRHHRLEFLLDAETAQEIVKLFTEVIIAPEVSDEAKAIIATKPNLGS